MAGLLDLFGADNTGNAQPQLIDPRQAGLLGFLAGMQKSGALDYTAPFLSGKVPSGFAAGLAGGAGGMLAGQQAALNMAKTQAETGLLGINTQKGKLELQYLPAQIQAQLGLLQAAGEAPPPMFGGSPGAAIAGVSPQSTNAPQLTSAPDDEADMNGPALGRAIMQGQAPLAMQAADALKKAGASDAFVQGALANGLAEGGFSEPWKKAGGSENSFGHWQFNAGGELPGFQQFAGGARDTVSQALYLLNRMKQIDPAAVTTDDPRAATDAIQLGFEKNAGARPGQRYGYLKAALQMYPGGNAAQGAVPAPAAPQGLLAQAGSQAAPAPQGGLLGAQPPQMPQPMPAAAPPAGQQINPAYIQWAQRQARIYTALGRPVPPEIAAASQLPLVGPKAAAEANAQVPAHNAEKQFGTNEAIREFYTTLPGKEQLERQARREQGEQQRQTEAVQPRAIPQEGIFYPPGSPGALQIQNGTMQGQALPDNVQQVAGGGFRVMPSGPTTGQVDEAQKDFLKLKDEAAAAREGLYKSQLLREQLHQIGTSGPLTEHLADLGALAQQMGVSEATVHKYLGVKPANAEAAEKLSQDLLGEVLKQTFPQRITNADITAWKNTVPRGTMLQNAYDLLLDKTVAPKMERTIARYSAVAGLPATDPQLRTYTGKLEEFDKANPWQSFVHTYAYGPGGHRLMLQGNQWVDEITRKPVAGQ